MKLFSLLLVGLVGVVLIPKEGEAWGSSGDKVLLKEIDVLTLRHGQWTKGRRSAGVPQLNCVGGSAGCTNFVPQVVQCYNKGSDGFDIQWQCKTDMDNAYRFGKVEVTCEGYDYPEDPYVLKGSCGLDYTIDLTKEGMANQEYGNQHNYYGGGDQGQSYGWKVPQKQSSSQVTNIACLVVLGIIVYAIYRTCIAPSVHRQQFSSTNDDYPRPDSRGGGPGSGSRPPPPGFNPGYYPNSGDFSDSCGAGSSTSAGAGAAPRAGGFWTGAATGGLLGYLFGSRGNNAGGYNTGYSTGYGRPSTSYGFRNTGGMGSSWGSGSSSSGFGSGASSSSGTRTASGFGGTRRR